MEEKRLCIRGLPERTGSDELIALLEQFGSISDIHVQNPKTNGATVFGFVTIKCNTENLDDCFRLVNNSVFKGSVLKVELAKKSFIERLQSERKNIVTAPVIDVRNELDKIEIIPKRKAILDIEFEEPKVAAQKVATLISKPNKSNFAGPFKAPPKRDKIKSDRIRLASIEVQNAQFLARQQAVASALQLTDSTKSLNKKIIFNDSDDQEKKQNLFESDDEDEEQAEFKLKPQFEGSEGVKLLELQSTYNNDARFKLDDRFAATENQSGVESKNNGQLTEENSRNLAILENVLGHSVNVPITSKKTHFRDPSFLRFDPTKSNAKKFLVSSEDVTTELEVEKSETKEVQQNDVRFYTVSENLKEAFSSDKSENSTFSLLKMFSNAPDVEIKAKETETVNETTQIIQQNLPKTSKPSEQQVSLPSKPRNNTPFFVGQQILSEGALFIASKSSSKMSENWDQKKNEISKYLRHKKRRTLKRRPEFQKKRIGKIHKK